jgi:uncharacterized Zn-binding protein involved in type VI secretion
MRGLEMLAARITDSTIHPPAFPGTIVGAGVATVLIEGLPAAVTGDAATCAVPPPPGHSSVFSRGSATVRIGGRFALRVGDTAACGAAIARGASRVWIG